MKKVHTLFLHIYYAEHKREPWGGFRNEVRFFGFFYTAAGRKCIRRITAFPFCPEMMMHRERKKIRCVCVYKSERLFVRVSLSDLSWVIMIFVFELQKARSLAHNRAHLCNTRNVNDETSSRLIIINIYTLLYSDSRSSNFLWNNCFSSKA